MSKREKIIKIFKNPIFFIISLIVLVYLSTMFLNYDSERLDQKQKEKSKNKDIENTFNAEKTIEEIKKLRVVEKLEVNDIKLYKENDKYSVTFAIDNKSNDTIFVDNYIYFGKKSAKDDIYEETPIYKEDGVEFSKVTSEDLDEYIKQQLKENKEIKLIKKIFSSNKELLGIVEIKVGNKVEENEKGK